ncbi:pilus assembly protein CpaB [Nocardioides sp. Y6]|uniref:Pilus assembly protein CpaB n=1 Tax=Nocardioides malaquae TaxID=2773426 RepID=A0ABR9RV21_9ACTN|nr:SAF domain-containing protein [Nocardioides malaquae]MBE7325353.1 pilus assembly protein CpaB [Nocardioides malaquae]
MASTSLPPPLREGPHSRGPDRPARLRRWWRRHVVAHRRLLVALCLGLAALGTLRTVAPAPPPTDEVLVAARDLPAGTELTHSDLTLVTYARGTAPDGAQTDPLGATLASPLRRGEAVTDVRLLTPDLMDGHPGRVAVPVRVVDPAAADLLRVGDTVDLLSADPATGDVTVVARAARVVALPPEPDGVSGQGSSGRVVVVALTHDEVEPVTVATVRQFLTVVWSR